MEGGREKGGWERESHQTVCAFPLHLHVQYMHAYLHVHVHVHCTTGNYTVTIGQKHNTCVYMSSTH